MASELVMVARELAGGGSSFVVFGRGTDPKRIFEEMRRDIRRSSGYEGYSGTVAEKDGFEVVAEPMSRDEALRYASREAARNDKWGPAWAVPVLERDKVVGYLFFGMASS